MSHLEQLAAEVRHLTAQIPREAPLPASLIKHTLKSAYPCIRRGTVVRDLSGRTHKVAALKKRLWAMEKSADNLHRKADGLYLKISELRKLMEEIE